MRNGAKLFAVGVGSSGVGVAVTNSLIWARERMDPKFVNENPPQVGFLYFVACLNNKVYF